MKTHTRIPPVLIGLALFGFSLAPAATITQTVGDNAPTFFADWNAAIWGNGGSGPEAPTSGNDYVTATGLPDADRIRISADKTDSTFGGDSLTLVSDTVAFVKLDEDNTATVNGNFILDGGHLRWAVDEANKIVNPTLVATQFDINSDSLVSSPVRNNAIRATMEGTLTGAGNLSISSDAASADNKLSITDISSYTGNVDVTDMIVEFGADYSFSGNFDLSAVGSRLSLGTGTTLTFNENALTYNDGSAKTVAPGTYSGSSLDTLGANFVNDGGTLVVIPEPGTGVLMLTALGACYLFSIRRRKR